VDSVADRVVGLVVDRPPPKPPVQANIKVLIVEDQEVIRRGLLAITASIPEVAASAVAISAHGAEMPSRFDVALISTSTLMNAERAGATVEHLRPMIVIVPTAQPQQLEIATRRPANGYIMQDEVTCGSLRTVLLQVVDGQLAIPSTIAAYLLNRVRSHDAMPLTQLYRLRPREAEVLTLLVAGDSNKEIASKLRISIHGVKRHVSTLLGQFHSPNRAHLVSNVLRSGMIPSVNSDI
jgi:two-component system nitrate/nitrite response regulator NarL